LPIAESGIATMGGRIHWSIFFRSTFAVRRSQAPFCDRIAEEPVIGTFSEIQQLDQTGTKCLGGLIPHPNDLSFCGRKYKQGKDLSTTLNAPVETKRRAPNGEPRAVNGQR
jgi:hypothetical protein